MGEYKIRDERLRAEAASLRAEAEVLEAEQKVLDAAKLSMIFDEFDLNEFFKADGKEYDAKFKHKNYVQQWLDLIRGSGIKNAAGGAIDKVKSGAKVVAENDVAPKNILRSCLLPSLSCVSRNCFPHSKCYVRSRYI